MGIPPTDVGSTESKPPPVAMSEDAEPIRVMVRGRAPRGEARCGSQLVARVGAQPGSAGGASPVRRIPPAARSRGGFRRNFREYLIVMDLRYKSQEGKLAFFSNFLVIDAVAAPDPARRRPRIRHIRLKILANLSGVLRQRRRSALADAVVENA